MVKGAAAGCPALTELTLKQSPHERGAGADLVDALVAAGQANRLAKLTSLTLERAHFSNSARGKLLAFLLPELLKHQGANVYGSLAPPGSPLPFPNLNRLSLAQGSWFLPDETHCPWALSLVVRACLNRGLSDVDVSKNGVPKNVLRTTVNELFQHVTDVGPFWAQEDIKVNLGQWKPPFRIHRREATTNSWPPN